MSKITNLLMIILIFILNGCSYKSQSGIVVPSEVNDTFNIFISNSGEIEKNINLNNKECKVIQHIKVSIKKPTIFHKNPSKEQANYVLSEKAKLLNANVVKNIQYLSGVGFTTWGYMDAEGDALECK